MFLIHIQSLSFLKGGAQKSTLNIDDKGTLTYRSKALAGIAPSPPYPLPC